MNKDYDILVPISIINKLINHELDYPDVPDAILTDEEFNMLVEIVESNNQNYN